MTIKGDMKITGYRCLRTYHDWGRPVGDVNGFIDSGVTEVPIVVLETDEDLAWVREHWPGKLVVKGIQTLDDARRIASLGVDGITLSNHGGRQLDRAPIPFHLLPDVVREVGRDVEVHLDTGIMNGADIVASVALGARFTLVGRAYLYGLMAGGRAGVDRTIAILAEEITRTMKLLGARALEELEPAHVTQLERLAPRPRQTGLG
jgi:isopentenyl diphosphate isomerase/L-lactate dehydrogenase-like FMN-dependent dehydrogenase